MSLALQEVHRVSRDGVESPRIAARDSPATKEDAPAADHTRVITVDDQRRNHEQRAKARAARFLALHGHGILLRRSASSIETLAQSPRRSFSGFEEIKRLQYGASEELQKFQATKDRRAKRPTGDV
jgi:hypothetical protein